MQQYGRGPILSRVREILQRPNRNVPRYVWTLWSYVIRYLQNIISHSYWLKSFIIVFNQFFYGLYFLQPHAMEKYVVTEERWIQRLVNAHALHHTNHQHAMKVTVSNKASVKICKNIYDQSNDNILVYHAHTIYILWNYRKNVSIYNIAMLN